MANKPKGYIQEVLTGIFVLAVVILLGYFTIVISGGGVLGSMEEVEYTATFDNVGALKLQDPVFVRGLKVGSVQKMILRPDGVSVTFRMHPDVKLRDDYSLTVGQTSLLGGTCLNVNPGVGSAVMNPSTTLVGKAPGNLVADLNDLVNDLRDSFEPEDLHATISNARVVAQELAVMTQRVNRGEGLVGELLAPQSQMADDVRVTLKNLRVASQQLNNEESLMGKVLHADDTLYDDLAATIKNARTFTEQLNNEDSFVAELLANDSEMKEEVRLTLANLRQFTEKLNSDESMVGQLLAKDSALMEDLNVTVANLRDITTNVAEGKGTLGKLVYDDAIAVEAEAVIKDVRHIIDNLRDTAPVTSFTSIFFGGF